MEEAHQILYNTKSTELKSFPAHLYYKKITDLMGRKRMFKYSIIVTQKVMEIYFGFRKSFDYLLLGSVVFQYDKDYMHHELDIDDDHIKIMTNLPKYSWSITSISKYQSRKKNCVNFFKAYLSQCGQP